MTNSEFLKGDDADSTTRSTPMQTAKEIAELDESWKGMLILLEEGRIDDASDLADTVLFAIDDTFTDGVLFGPTIVKTQSGSSSFIFHAINRVMAKSACRLVRALAAESH